MKTLKIDKLDVDVVSKQELKKAVLLFIKTKNRSTLTKESIQLFQKYCKEGCLIYIANEGDEIKLLDEKMMNKAGWIKKK